MATGLQFKENLTIISGGYRGEGVGSNGVTQNWTETQGDSGSSTVTYWYHDSAQMTDRNSTLVEVSVTDSWTAVKEADNTYKVTIHSVMNFIRRTKVGSPSALSASIFVRRERGGSNIWTSGGCVNAAASATHATNVDLGTYTITLPPGQPAATHGAIYYRSNICGHDRTNPPSIYVDEYWLGINFRNTLPPDYRPGQTWSNTGSSVQTVTGTSINVSNTLQGSFEELVMSGDTTQTTYSGKNLFDDVLDIQYPDSTIMKVTTDPTIGSVTMEALGSAGSQTAFFNIEVPDANSTYCLSGIGIKNQAGSSLGSDGRLWVRYRVSNNGTSWTGYYTIFEQIPASVGQQYTFSGTISGYKYYQFLFYNYTVNGAPTGEKTTYTNIQLEKGSTATSYERYVGGTASPNPDYPQGVQTVTGRQVVTITDGGSDSQEYEINLGKNLLDNYNPTVVSANTTWTPTANGGLYTATSGWTGGVQWKLTVETGATYQFQYKERTDQNLYLYITTYTDSTYTTVKTRLVNDGRYTKYPIAPDSPYLEISFNNSAAMTNVAIEELMFEKASTRTTYAPYFTPIELCKIGTYQDYIYQSGNDWYVQSNVGEVALDSDATWTLTESSGNYLFSTDKPADAAANARCSSDYLTWNTDMQTANTVCINGASLVVVNPWEAPYGEKAPITTLYDFKNWLSRNNPSVYYVLDQPQDRQLLLPDVVSELNSAKNGGSYTGTTTINVTGDLASPLTVGVRVATGSGTWQSHNRNGGWAGVYNGSTFKEMRTVNGPDGTGDPPTIKHPSGWKNQRKIGLNS